MASFSGELAGVKEGFIDGLFASKLDVPEFGLLERNAHWERVVRGGYPEPLDRPRPERRRAGVNSYITTIIERDVRDLANIDGLAQLPRFMRLLARRTASLLNYAELSRSMGLPQTTLKRYPALLESIFLVHRLPPWSGNLGKRLVKSPKVFLNETGLAAGLLAVDGPRLEADGVLSGPLLENFVMTELSMQAIWSETRPRLHHFRTESGREVDFVLEDSRGRCVGIEVKAGSVGAGDMKGLSELSEVLGTRFLRGVILHTGRATVPFARNLHALPINALWELGASRV